MWRQFGLLCALLGATASADSNNDWHMTPVKIIQARVQGDPPVWHPEVNLWLSKYGDTTEAAYVNNLDTVNMASVEGALMYVQAEGINVNEQSVKCQRKNNMQYVVFYEMTIVQPTYSIKYYENHTPPEYGDFVAMDGAKCTNAGADLPKSCKVYYGLDGTMDIGPNVGCNPQGSDPRAPYPDNYWCSFPNSCAQKYRAEKTAECRAQYNGGLCPMGVADMSNDISIHYLKQQNLYLKIISIVLETCVVPTTPLMILDRLVMPSCYPAFGCYGIIIQWILAL
ncbi:hypothetical protein PPTG_07844 [Phytophthora nicotianae INRA-310]|uniref:Uncharacterized protein n=1 Tax=Phytophthora nicotianae (strain INRA-310) TaxID=761204 RepID=W2QNW0_PHYN3|nr:hypothetical protein PPTG_07844 [Phytophthora nicotianae INRA-310]ETN14194.1 hypothetical protein PPTG_07844 [Phytophthora nicotianae INRA-310]